MSRVSSRATIFQPAKTAMQSGRGNANEWLLVFDQAQSKPRDPLMGWTGSFNPLAQVRLKFSSLEEAEHYAKAQNIDYEVRIPPKKHEVVKAYSDNFSAKRSQPWTH